MATINYKLIKNFFNKEELKLYQKYCLYKLQNSDFKIDNEVFSPAWYGDPLMISILDQKLSLVEKESNLKLFPTYSYWRYYVLGGTLRKHTDRPSCEVSVTACIKKHDNWPLIIEDESFELEEGDGLLYAGCIQKHERPGIYKGEGLAQVFFHYVDQDGPFKHHAYDNTFKNTGYKSINDDSKIINNIKNKL